MGLTLTGSGNPSPMTMAITLLTRWAARRIGELETAIDLADSIWDDLRSDDIGSTGPCRSVAR